MTGPRSRDPASHADSAHPASAGVLGLSRESLASRTLIALHRGSWDSPDVLLVDSEAGPVVVKDFAPRRAFVARTLGRWLIARERRALVALHDHAAVPRLLGSLDAYSLVLEHRGGVHISARRPWTFDASFCDRLADAIAGLHRRGVVHLDLRHRSNVRADLRGEPVLIDFDSALTFRVGGFWARVLLPLLARADRRALDKWRARIARDWKLRMGADWMGADFQSGPTGAIQSDGSRGASLPMK